MSAFGFLSSNIQNEFAVTYLKIAEKTPMSELMALLKKLQTEATQWLDDEGVPANLRQFDFFVDCRYYLQNIQIPCQVHLEELEGKGFEVLRDQFEQEHRRRFGFDLSTSIEMATVRVVGKGTIEGVSLTEEEMTLEDNDPPVERRENVYFTGKETDTPLYNRNHLKPGQVVIGPAVILQEDSTVVIEPGYRGKIDEFRNILIDKEVAE
ncbi:hypothetical protein [Salicibibacter cibarius]|uniref:hypothetical protein n=1 Tax=Salicibibacter cibarius TaxID=2743000 RepID=UPI003CCDDB02